MRLRSSQPSRGYTLIEIVLVLAIAGLLLLLVFLALAGAQRARRDSQRKQDLSRVFGAVETYQSNNKGQVPVLAADFVDLQTNYLQNLNDPSSGAPYLIPYRPIDAPHSSVPPVGTIYYQQAHWCNRGPQSMPDEETDPIAGNDTSLTKFVVWTSLESGGVFCLDNL